jgi:hypothetical protein
MSLLAEETEVSVLTNEHGDERVLILRRLDGSFTYRRQWASGTGWGNPGPACGVYDSAFTAENEARARVSWLHPIWN